MRGTLKINQEKGIIIMSREFAKAASDTLSPEYLHLQEVKRDNPTFTIKRKTINPNPNKETWKGLTYEYMINYIISHEPVETKKEVLAEFAELKLISECHAKGKRYPVIKNWFLNKYPAIKEFGMPKEEETAAAAATILQPDFQEVA